jgi:ATP/maltotriose-dependent transcriptional regulator MalT
MMQTRELWLRRQIFFLLPVTDVWAARETARRGDHDAAIAVMRQAVDELREGYPFYGVWATGVLMETLLERAAEGDLTEAQEAIDWIANVAAEHNSAVLAITLLRLRALLSRARGDEMDYRDYRDRYRAMAKSLGFEGHVDWAENMTEGGK